jgi:hypothetical protein
MCMCVWAHHVSCIMSHHNKRKTSRRRDTDQPRNMAEGVEQEASEHCCQEPDAVERIISDSYRHDELHELACSATRWLAHAIGHAHTSKDLKKRVKELLGY